MTVQALPTEQLWVHCDKCDYEQALGFLPMPVSSVVAIMKTAKCPNGHPRKALYPGQKPKTTKEGDPIAWLRNGDTGISSETIWGVMMGRPSPRHSRDGIPRDPADFGRCYRLLKVMPSWRERLPEVSAQFKDWAPLVEHWDELTALYEEEEPKGTAPKLYARMRELRGEK